MNKNSKIKIILFLMMFIIILTFISYAQFSESIQKSEISSPVTNNGPVISGKEIIFYANCEGENAKLIICKNNAICNLDSQQEDIICNSQFSNESEKS